MKQKISLYDFCEELKTFLDVKNNKDEARMAIALEYLIQKLNEQKEQAEARIRELEESNSKLLDIIVQQSANR